MENISKDSKPPANQFGAFQAELKEDYIMLNFRNDSSNIAGEKPAAVKTGIIILKMTGTIDLLSSSEFQNAALNCISKGFKYILLDFTAVNFIDSMGLSTLLMIYQKICETGGALTIINPKPSIMVVLKITKVNQKILVFSTIEEAKNYIAGVTA